VLATRGEAEGICFVFFGAEERGLFGSKAYADSLTDEEEDALVAMLNFDVTGTGGIVVLSGSDSLADAALDIAGEIGIGATGGDISASDHTSFREAGFEALMFSGGDFSQIHTPEDLPNLVDPGLLQETAELALALLESLREG
jgi:aminopeptidase YwaD